VAKAFERLRTALAEGYRIERELGAGGMATVYLAQDLRNKRRVAIKVLREELAATIGEERFHREIQIAAQLQHPNILPLLESGDAEGLFYYTMPYVEGQSLRERMVREGALPVADAVRILRDVADALTEAHAHGVVHRDIKPENILLRGRHALVADFGVAKAVSEATGRQALTTGGVALGTPAYMAPEQTSADPHLDHRVDIYALGAVGYEMLTGRPVFMGTSPQMVLSAHMTETPRPISELRESVPQALEALVMRCLAKERADRWQSAEELVAQLEALATPSGGTTPTQTHPIVAAARKRKLEFGIAGAAVVIAVLGIALALPRRSGTALDPNRVLVVAFADQSGAKQTHELGRMAQDYIIQVLTEAGFAKVVDPLTALAVSQNVGATGPAEDAGGILALAQEAGAGTVVSGNYYAEGDSLYIQARVSNARDGSLMGTVGPIVGSNGARRELVARVGRDVVAALAPLLSRDLGSFEPVAQPATYEAYEAYTEGLEAYFDNGYDDAARDFERAVVADPTFIRARLWAAQSLVASPFINYRPEVYGKVASLLAPLVQARDQLSRYDRCRLDFVMALGRPDLSAMYDAARCMAAVAPGSDDAKREVALFTYRLNRPRETLRLLRELDPDHGLMKRWWEYWNYVTAAYHVLGDYQHELEAARQGRRRHPANLAMLYNEARALAAMGRLNDLAASLRDMRALQPPDMTPWYLSRVGHELRVHGYPDAARAVFDESITWYRSRSQDAEEKRAELAEALYQAGRWDDARPLYEELARQRPKDRLYLAALGKLAARRGDRAAALSASEQLRSMRNPVTGDVVPAVTLERARIAALLGNREEAVALLQQGIGQGAYMAPQWGVHDEIDFASLQDYPPFRELVRPKG
jgi:tRNA A-37 threonylcarbamoyl transferase component Bud32/tetratricopeptide (TPR) repeat protein